MIDFGLAIELEHGEDHIICKERHTQFICTEVYFKMGIVQPYLNGLCLTFSKFQSEFLRVQGNFSTLWYLIFICEQLAITGLIHLRKNQIILNKNEHRS